MTITCRGLHVKTMDQANAVSPTSIEGSFCLVVLLLLVLLVDYGLLNLTVCNSTIVPYRAMVTTEH